MHKKTRSFLPAVIGLVLVLLACRTLDLAFDVVDPRATAVAVTDNTAPTDAPTHRAPTRRPPTEIPQPPPTQSNPQHVVAPTEPPPPPAAPEPTDLAEPVETEPPKPKPTTIAHPATVATATPQLPTATPGPTACPKKYCVVYRGCQPDGNTIVEGIVYNNGVPEDGVAVRVAKSEGAYPLVDDFKSGSDPINPGQPDPKNPGRYFLQIVAGAPREGNWWVFVVDQVNGTKQISEAKLIHTNDDNTNPANCQHAFVDFVR